MAYSGKLLVVGTPKGGTTYLYHLLTCHGIDVGHERVNTQGTVSGFLIDDYDDYPCPHRHEKDHQHKNFSDRVWLMRDALDSVRSIADFLNNGREPTLDWYESIGCEIDRSDYLKTALSIWVFTHQTIASYEDKIDLYFPLEHTDKFFPLLADIVHVGYNLPKVQMHYTTEQFRTYTKPSWEELQHKYGTLADTARNILEDFTRKANNQLNEA